MTHSEQMLRELLQVLESDAHALTFQSLGQYRTSLISMIKDAPGCAACAQKDREIALLTSMVDLSEALRARDGERARAS